MGLKNFLLIAACILLIGCYESESIDTTSARKYSCWADVASEMLVDCGYADDIVYTYKQIIAYHRDEPWFLDLAINNFLGEELATREIDIEYLDWGGFCIGVLIDKPPDNHFVELYDLRPWDVVLYYVVLPVVVDGYYRDSD